LIVEGDVDEIVCRTPGVDYALDAGCHRGGTQEKNHG
jgi:hypothetical protein